jgi:hypothetical protein
MKLDAIRKNNKPQMTSSTTVDNFKQCSIPAPQRARCDRKKTMVRTAKFFAVTAFLFFLSSTAFSSPMTLNWTDNVIHWTGWGGGAGNEDLADVIGVPQISGGTVTITNGYLTQVLFSYNRWDYSTMHPGDVFLDTNSDNKWDYVVSLYNNDTSSTDTSTHYLPTSDLSKAPVYSFSQSFAPTDHTLGTPGTLGYLVTNSTDTGSSQYYWSGSDIRNNQPFAVTGLNSTNSVLLTNSSTFATVSYVVGTNPGSLIFNIPSGIVPFSGSVTIGFATNCANDVVYATSAVPEPGTTVLLGSGLIMVIGLLRRKNS